jgi:DNA-binding CsgD family transcriptional regulator
MDIDKELGICVKNNQKVVSFQNDICIETCGNMVGKACEKGCMKSYDPSLSNIQNEGMTILKNSEVDGHSTDAVIINNTVSLITLIYPLKQKIKKIEDQMLDLKKFGLTNSESDILAMKMKGMKNTEIAQKLFIAKVTLKTHLNNIYKKIPSEWKFLKEKK